MTEFSRRVSIVVLNWNGINIIGELLNSLKQQTYTNYEIIMVDNNSTDGSTDYVAKNYPYVKIIQNKENVGVAAGYNTGIKRAQGDLILLLNNDTVLDRRFLEELVRAMYITPSVGVVGGRIFAYGKISHLPHIFFPSFDRPWIVLFSDFSSYKNGSLETDVLTGCDMMVKKEVFDEVGLLDETFFYSLEYVDFCLRVKKAGYKLLLNLNAKLDHRASYSGRRMRIDKRIIHEAKGVFRYIWKSVPSHQRIPAIILNFVYSIIFKILMVLGVY